MSAPKYPGRDASPKKEFLGSSELGKSIQGNAWSRRSVIAAGSIGAASLLAGPRAEALPQAASRDPGLENGNSGDAWLNTPRADGTGRVAAYSGSNTDRVAYPLGGIGAGMVALEGGGALSRFSLYHRPDLQAYSPVLFAAIGIAGRPDLGRVLEGPVAKWKIMPEFAKGRSGTFRMSSWGLPRFADASFSAQFPFGRVTLTDKDFPLSASILGWSPFIPGDAASASLPVAAAEYHFVNNGSAPVDAMFSFHSENILLPLPGGLIDRAKATRRILPIANGFMLHSTGAEGQPWDEAWLAFWIEESGVVVDHCWFRHNLNEALDHVWSAVRRAQSVAQGPVDADVPGASIYVPLRLAPGERRSVALRMAWYVPRSNVAEPSISLHGGKPTLVPPRQPDTYRPWYAGRFGGIKEVVAYWREHYAELRAGTRKFSRTLHASTLPSEAMEAIDNNLTILKSPTVLRQIDGRFWGWEGSYDEYGSCFGSSTHVWNYAQALAHLQPELERSLRETEFHENQEPDGFQRARAALPIRRLSIERDGELAPATSPPAADGQLGGILKVYREWRISGDTAWLKQIWPRVRDSLEYCIRTWDPRERGWLEEPHLNTYDVEFWGPDGLHSSLYVGALTVAAKMNAAVGDPNGRYPALAAKARMRMEKDLFNGDYFYQRTMRTGLSAKLPRAHPFWKIIIPDSPEVAEIMHREGPLDQYGEGCLSDGVFGLWLARMCGWDESLIDSAKVTSHLTSVFRSNFRPSLKTESAYARAYLAFGDEPGLLVCSWPRGGKPTVPFLFATEVWAGIEYQVAGHLAMVGHTEEAGAILKGVRRRYDGTVRNPYSSLEAGHWYARALASYGLLQAYGGARFDAVDRVLYLNPAVAGDFQCFLATATGYGLVGVRSGAPFVDVVEGKIPYERIEYEARR